MYSIGSINGIPLVPRDGRVLRVVIVARISTEHQDLKSLDDQAAKCRHYLSQHYDGEVAFEIISDRGSGEHLDRQSYLQLGTRIQSRQIDVVLVEDLSRICRRIHAVLICEDCEDCETRLIAINDHVDTAAADWRRSAIFSAMHHEQSNVDTAGRISRTLNNRFDNGGVVQFVLFGYIKPPGAKKDSEILKDPSVEEIILDLFRRLEGGASYAELADWLNENSIPPGPCCRLNRWDAQMVRRWVHNPLLKGERVRNRMVSKRNNKTGRHSSVKADPKLLRVRKCPNLAYFDAAYYDHVIQLLKDRNRGCHRTANGKPDPRLGVSRKRTLFPGQHAVCGICGRLMHWHGMKGEQVMLCSGAADYRCWNGLYVNGGEANKRIAAAVGEAMASMPDFDVVFGQLAREEARHFEDQQNLDRRKLESDLDAVEQSLQRVTNAIERRPESEALLKRLDALEVEKKQLEYSLSLVVKRQAPLVALPDAEARRLQALASLQDLMSEDPEAQRLARVLIPDLKFVPYEVCDQSNLVLRAEFTLTLLPLLPAELSQRAEAETYVQRLVVDIGPEPQPIRFREKVTQLKSAGKTLRTISKELDLAYSNVIRSLNLQSEMQRQGLAEPYVRCTELPERQYRLRRHQHERYVFEPLQGFPASK